MSSSGTAQIGLRIFLADTASAGITALTGILLGLGTGAASLNSIWKSLAPSTQALGVLAASAGVSFLAFGGALAYAVDQAGNLQQQMANIEVAVDGADSHMGELQQTLIQVSDNSIFSATEVAAAFVSLGQHGQDATSIIDGTGQAAIFLAEATQSQAAPAASLLGQVLQEFNMTAAQSEQAATDLAFAYEHGIPSVQDLSSAFAQAGPAAAALGIPLNQLVPVLDYLAQRMGSGSKAGTALAYMLSALQDPTNKAMNELAQLGVVAVNQTSPAIDTLRQELEASGGAAATAANQYDGSVSGLDGMFKAAQALNILPTSETFMQWATASGTVTDSLYGANGQFLGMNNMLNVIFDTISKLNPQQQALAIGQLFNVRSGKGAMDMIKDWKDGKLTLANYEQELQKYSAEGNAEKKTNTLSGAVSRLTTNFQNFMAGVGNADLGPVQRVFNSLANVLGSAYDGKSLTTMGSNILNIGLAASAGVGSLAGIGFSLGMIKKLGAAAETQKLVRGFGDLLSPLGKLAALGPFVSNAFSGFAYVLPAVVPTVLSFAASLLPIIGVALLVVGAIVTLVLLFTTFKKQGMEIVGFIQSAFTPVFRYLAGFVVAAFAQIKTAWASVQPQLTQGMNALVGAIHSAMPAFQAIGIVIATVVGVVIWAVGSLVSAFIQALPFIIGVFTGIFNVIGSVTQLIVAIFTGHWGKIPGILGGIFGGLWQIISNALGMVLVFVGSFFNNLLGGIPAKLLIQGQKIAGNLIHGLLSGLSALGSSVGGLLGRGLQGALSGLSAAGKWLMAVLGTIGSGLKTAFGVVWTALQPVVTALKADFQPALDSMSQTYNSNVKPALAGLHQSFVAVQQIVAILGGALSAVGGFFSWIGGIIGGVVLAAFQLFIARAQQTLAVLRVVGQWILSGLVPVFQLFAAKIGQIVKFVSLVGQLLLSQLMPVLHAVAVAWQWVTSNVHLLLVPLLVLAGIVGSVLALALASLMGALNGLLRGLGTFLAGIFKFAAGLFQTFAGVIQIITGLWLAFFTILKDLFTGHLNNLGKDLQGALHLITSGIQNILHGMFAMLEGLFQASFGALWAFVKGFASGFMGTINTILSWFPNNVKTMLANAATGFSSGFTNIVKGISTFVTNAITTFAHLVTQLPLSTLSMVTSVLGYIGGLEDKAIGLAAGLVSGFISKLAALPGQAVSNVQSMTSKLMGLLTSFQSKMTGLGSSIVQGLVNGIKGMGASAVAAMTGLGQSMLNGFKSMFHISSPSAVMHQMGGFVSQGLLNGITSLNVATAAGKHFGTIIPAAQAAVSGATKAALNATILPTNSRVAGAYGAGAGGATTVTAQPIVLQVDGKNMTQVVMYHTGKALRLNGINRLNH